ncbi:MAG TPA: hypothetical protein VHV30_04265 [Polyangiaceae bacterium]|jgi:hypothetical protein|nr:hypothetical protein [Polyangiaceae bacterium]
MSRAEEDPLGGWVYVLLGLAEDEIDDVIRLGADSLETALRARGKSPDSIPRVAVLIERARAVHPLQARSPQLLMGRAKPKHSWIFFGVVLLLVLVALAIGLGIGTVLRARWPASAAAISSSFR